MPILEIISRRDDEIIVRVSGVDRTRDRWRALDRIGRRARMNHGIVGAMPRGEGAHVEIAFCRWTFDRWSLVNGIVGIEQIKRQFELCSLVPDPYAQAAVNEADPAFADRHPNATCWKDKNWGWCSITFGTSDIPPARCVEVLAADCNWPNNLWWFAGIRKSKPAT